MPLVRPHRPVIARLCEEQFLLRGVEHAHDQLVGVKAGLRQGLQKKESSLIRPIATSQTTGRVRHRNR